MPGLQFSFAPWSCELFSEGWPLCGLAVEEEEDSCSAAQMAFLPPALVLPASNLGTSHPCAGVCM